MITREEAEACDGLFDLEMLAGDVRDGGSSERWLLGEDRDHRARGRRRHAYLDSAATSLPLTAVMDAVRAMAPHLGNSHSRGHACARMATHALRWSRERILSFVGAPAEEYTVLFCGHGATAAINRFASKLARGHADRDIVLVSTMEHHSNDLPHRRAAKVEHIALDVQGARGGGVSLRDLEQKLRDHAGRVRYVAVTAASNVTGVVTEIHEIAARCRAHRVPLLVDGAACIAHAPLCIASGLAGSNVDALAFSGHKMYAPMSPGVLVIRRSLLSTTEPVELGGGMVDEVTQGSFTLKHDATEREQAGTANVGGALMIALACEWLSTVGMEQVVAHELALTRYLLDELRRIPEVRLYGTLEVHPGSRIGIVPFNVGDIPHGLAAAVLDDVHDVAVRNDCFCAQPYVRQLLLGEFLELADTLDPADQELESKVEQRRGMLRVSFGLHNTRADVDQLVHGVLDLVARRARYEREYVHLGGGVWERRGTHGAEFRPEAHEGRLLRSIVERLRTDARAPRREAAP